ncbi:ABC transporter permease [Poseidonibacter lekithochrous]|uniref:ABC transporter permease n=1 Tax=Poseidonibacter TaxID=2321187 RepID=UPI001C0A1DED|nr:MULTISPECIES: ABC transporter permease [Poseidonibacter]MBU3014054.1 ABC transporter permease [Poseidonibacter lekithochrous]MDO6827350.1 ABC transporter permease [Poseidonibacter sp. 1_MG-2023]
MTKRKPFTIFKSSIFALFLIEMYDSVGIKKSGYFWLFFDVLFIVFIFAGVRGFLRGLHIPGLDSIVFLAINVSAFFYFRTTVQMLMSSFGGASKKLFDYRQIKPIDIVISKFIFNTFIRILAVFILLFIGWYFEFDLSIKDFNMVMLAVLWLAVFSFGIGMLSAVLGNFFEAYKKILGFMMLPLLFTSAVFYTVDSLPAEFRVYILYNPVVHFMELLHGSYFHVLDTKYVDYIYMTYWTVIPLFLGLYLYAKSEENIIAS